MYINALVGENGIITQAQRAKREILNAQVESDEKLNALEEEINNIVNEENHVNTDIAKFKAGDYVKYHTGDTSVGENGVIICRVLYEANSEYGLQIISDKNVKELTLGGNDWKTGKASYNDAITTLNKEAEKYVNSQYAVDARCVGSVPTNSNGVFINKKAETNKTVVLPFNEWSNYTKPTEWESNDTGCKDIDNNYKIDYNTMEVLGIKRTGEDYWLASRYVGASSTDSTFDIRFCDSSGYLGNNYLCHVNSSGITFGGIRTNGIRVCFSLKSDIQISSGDGASEQTAYILK